MPSSMHVPIDPDLLFTVATNLMWQLHDDAEEQGVLAVQIDLVLAVGELEMGPWRYLGRTPEIGGVRYVALCSALDRILAELARATPGFGARVAIARARSSLDPDH